MNLEVTYSGMDTDTDDIQVASDAPSDKIG